MIESYRTQIERGGFVPPRLLKSLFTDPTYSHRVGLMITNAHLTEGTASKLAVSLNPDGSFEFGPTTFDNKGKYDIDPYPTEGAFMTVLARRSRSEPLTEPTPEDLLYLPRSAYLTVVEVNALGEAEMLIMRKGRDKKETPVVSVGLTYERGDHDITPERLAKVGSLGGSTLYAHQSAV